MTYSYGITIKKADAAGGVAYRLGPPCKVSDKDPDDYFRKLVAANLHPLGAIIEKLPAERIRTALDVKGGIIVRFHPRGGRSAYLLLHVSELLSAESPS